MSATRLISFVLLLCCCAATAPVSAQALVATAAASAKLSSYALRERVVYWGSIRVDMDELTRVMRAADTPSATATPAPRDAEATAVREKTTELEVRPVGAVHGELAAAWPELGPVVVRQREPEARTVAKPGRPEASPGKKVSPMAPLLRTHLLQHARSALASLPAPLDSLSALVSPLTAVSRAARSAMTRVSLVAEPRLLCSQALGVAERMVHPRELKGLLVQATRGLSLGILHRDSRAKGVALTWGRPVGELASVAVAASWSDKARVPLAQTPDERLRETYGGAGPAWRQAFDSSDRLSTPARGLRFSVALRMSF